MEEQIHSHVLTHLHPNCRLDKNFLTYDIITCWLFIGFRIDLGIGQGSKRQRTVVMNYVAFSPRPFLQY
ncbi:hypothetical protein Hanom_Chr13g01238581 [Helianthus anomalus]